MKKRQLFIRLFTCLMVFTMSFGLMAPFVASADTKSDYEDAQERLDEINKEIANLNDQKKKQQAQKTNAQTQINLVKNQISILNSDIKKTNEELEEKQLRLEEKKEDIRETDALFRERLKAMYIMRSGGTLSTILAVDSFSQLLTAADTLQRISMADTDLLKELDDEKKIIETEEAEIQQEINKLVEKQGTLENKQAELAGYMKTLDSQLSETAAREKAARETQKEVYAEYLAAKQALEAAMKESSNNTVIGSAEYIWPVPTNGYISSGFGPRTLYGAYDYHTGIDISTGWGNGWPAISGQKIVASNSGVVTKAIGYYSDYTGYGYGNYVIIDHGNNNFSLYGHCKSISVKVGDVVTQGQKIGTVGSTGNSTGPHLHFEIRINGSAVDPKPYVIGTKP